MRRIKNAKITTLALCRKGKNSFTTLLKSDGQLTIDFLAKAGPIEGEVLAVVYAPDKPDADGDVADASVIRKMAHEYVRDHLQLDIEHDGEILPKDAAYVAESFIVAKGDERFVGWKDYEGRDVGDLTGAWAVVLQLNSEPLRKAWAAGILNGISMFGSAAVEPITKAAPFNMDETKLAQLIKAAFAEVMAASTQNQAAVEKSENDFPAFEGDPSSAEDLEAYEATLRRYEFQKAVAAGKMTPAKIAEMRKALSEKPVTVEELAKAGIPATSADSPEVRALQTKLFKALKASGQGAALPTSTVTSESEIAKAEAAEAAEVVKLLSGVSAPANSFRIL